MPRPTIIERARAYLAKFDSPRRAKIDAQDSHALVFSAACALVVGFKLPLSEATYLLREFCGRSDIPWSDSEIEYKINQADKCGQGDRGGLLAGERDLEVGEVNGGAPAPAPAPIVKPEFDETLLRQFAGDYAKQVDLLWLANRSELDPALVTSDQFLRLLFPGVNERVIVFNKVNRDGVPNTQGEAVWPLDPLPKAGPRGVWYLCQPVDGEYHPNPRSQKYGGEIKMSRRSEESVTAWRHMVLESDEAPVRLWLGALVRLPLRIRAIYTSGGRSVHALIEVNALSKQQWDDEKYALKHGLVLLGADPGALSAVRLTRLPQCWRAEKKAMQKLLYLNSKPQLRPLWQAPVIRDVESVWLRLADAGEGDADENPGWLQRGLDYYAPVSARLREKVLMLKGG